MGLQAKMERKEARRAIIDTSPRLPVVARQVSVGTADTMRSKVPVVLRYLEPKSTRVRARKSLYLPVLAPPSSPPRHRVIASSRHRVIKTGITRYLTQTTHRYLVFSRYLSNRVVLQVPFTALPIPSSHAIPAPAPAPAIPVLVCDRSSEGEIRVRERTRRRSRSGKLACWSRSSQHALLQPDGVFPLRRGRLPTTP